MKITVNTNALTQAVTTANKFMAKEGDFLGQIVLKGLNGKLEVLVTNIVNTFIAKDITFTSNDLTNDSFSSFSIDGKKLLTVLKSAKTDEVNMTQTDGFVFIKSGRSNVRLETLSETQNIVISEAKDKLVLSRRILDGFKQISHAVDNNNPKFELNGVLLQIKNSTISIVGTDTRRLSVVTSESESSVERDIIIPIDAINSLNNMLATYDFVEAELNDTNLTINTDTFSFSTKLVNGNYPDWARIVPKNQIQTLTIGRLKFAELLKEASLLDDDVIVDISNGSIILQDIDKNTQVIDSVTDENLNIKFCVYSKYALDFLNSYGEENVQVAFNGTNLPLLFIANPDYREVIMPVALEEEEQEQEVA